jgi:PAS domain S-box-containing protein
MSTQRPAQPASVLVAAGDPVERAGLTRALRAGGLGVAETAEVDETLRRAAADRPHLVLLGNSLRDLCRAEVCRGLRADPATSAIPVLMLCGTADLQGGDQLQVTAAPSELLARVQTLIRLHRAEEQARAARHEADEAQARLAALVEHSEDPILSTDLDWNVTSWNAAAERLYGYSAAEMLGRPGTILIPPDRHGELAGVKRRLTRGEVVPPFETVRLRRNGRRLDVSVRLSLVRDRTGAIIGTSGIVRDITERKRAEEALHQSEERYRSLFERNPHPMFVYDRDSFTYLAVNDAAVHQYGYTREEFLRMTIMDIRPAEDVPVLRTMLAHSGDGFEHRGVWRHRKKDGTLIDVEILAHALRFGDRPAGIVLAYDVTERRRLEEQFLQAQKMDAVGRLAGGVAHDFNNLLTVINGYADMLLEDLAEDAAPAAHVRAIRSAGERAAGLTQQLLAFGRKQIVTPRLLDLNSIVADAVRLLGRLIGEDILLDLDLQPGLGRVRADPNQLHQVLLNLAVNARDAMPRGGRLLLTTRDVVFDERGAGLRPGRYLVLAVTDTGHGMTEEVRRHLFEPFFTTKALGKGTGLGLATVYGIVKQAGGHIDVETSVDVGTTFRVYLPRAANPEPQGGAAGAASAAPRRAVALLAEDEDAVRALAREVLRTAGYEVLEARDGTEALTVAERYAGRIDVLLSDVVMPGLGGRQLADLLLARDPGLKVIFLSGYTEDAVVRGGVSREEMLLLPKPFAPAALVQKLRKVLAETDAR